MHCQRGLTLLELMVALSIFSVMAIVLFGSISLGGRAWATVIDSGREVDQMATAQSFLRTRIEQLDGDSLNGTATALSFRAPAPRAMATGELLEYAITLEPTDGVNTLVLRWRAPAPATLARVDEGWTTEPLATGVEQLTLSYLERGDHPAWVHSWSGRPDLPLLIRLQLRRSEGELAWPTLVVRPLITAGPDCAFDAVLMDCRR